MRVLHVYKSAIPYSMGGVEQVIHQLALHTARLGHEVTVLCVDRFATTKHELNVSKEYECIVERSLFECASTPFSLGAVSRFHELCASSDVVHMHYPWPFMDLMYFLRRPKPPVVLTYHSDIVRQKILLYFYRPLQRAFLSSVERIVATSPNYLATSTELSNRRSKVRIIPIGVDEAFYPKVDDSCLEFWKANLPAGPFFLFIGALRYYKGLHLLLEAVGRCGYPTVIVGAGPIERTLKRKTLRENIKNVYFLGYLSDRDKIALLSLCYAVVFPSHLRSEAFGLTLLEGAMMRKPLISSEIGTGTSFVNLDGVTGFVVEPNKPEALAEAMAALWADASLAKLMGLRARARYEELFSAQRMTNSYLNLYDELLNDQKVKWARSTAQTTNVSSSLASKKPHSI